MRRSIAAIAASEGIGGIGAAQRRRSWLGLLVAALLMAALPAAGQEEGVSAEDPEAALEEAKPAEERFSVTSILELATNTVDKLRKLEAESNPEPKLDKIALHLLDREEAIEQRTAQDSARIDGGVTLRQIADIESHFLSERSDMQAWRETVSQRGRALEDSVVRADEILVFWREALAESAEVGVRAQVAGPIQTTIAAAEATGASLSERWKEVLEIQAHVASAIQNVDAMLGRASTARESARQRLFGSDTAPLWEAFAQTGVGVQIGIGDLLLDSVRGQAQATAAYAQARWQRFAFQGLLAAAAFALALALRHRAVSWAEEDANFEDTARILARPFSVALTVAWMGVAVHENAPAAVLALSSLLALIPILRLVTPLLAKSARPLFYGLSALYLVDLLIQVMDEIPLLARIVFCLQMAATVLGLLWFLRPGRLQDLGSFAGGARFVGYVLRLWVVLAAVALGMSVIGLGELGRVIGHGVLMGSYVGVALFAGYRVLGGTVRAVLRVAAAQGLNLMRQHRLSATRRILWFLRVGAFLLWLYILLGLFSIREPVFDAIRTAVEAKLSVGDLSVSLSDVLALVVAIVLSVWISRSIRMVLEEDVLSRMSLPRGVPYAISASTGYAVLLIGFFAALAAAGIDLSKFAILAGALGVGVGFGLQNVVNNFVSGLILLFERPIQTGDTIQIAELLGNVQRIGIRSSTVRTLQGAEVIVPNASLISDQVVNWTLSDRQRRVEVAVGVAYGVDPERVLQLLLDVAAAEERLLQHPVPESFFLGFGASSLDFELRVWTSRYEEGIRIKSDLGVAINRALAEAGIEIPFPQRDLHLRSIDEASAKALGGGAEGGEGAG